jgi:pSer/pThr/pTyr-binding forkhead associated (FHA) protein
VVLKDLHSANGTYVNSTEVNGAQSTRLRDGDVVMLGKGNCASFIYQDSLDS